MEIIIYIFVIYIFYQLLKSFSSSQKSSKRSKITAHSEVSGQRGYNNLSSSNKRPSGKPAKWYGRGQSVNVQGYSIIDGLIYVGETLYENQHCLDSTRIYFQGNENDACLINPKLRVLPSEPGESDEEIGYWPQYGHIPARCRGAYLSWLASGRSEPKTNMGYVFLFFYGLERRLFIDGQREGILESERSEIIKEVNRLLNIYGENRSFHGYASNFLAMEWVLYQSNTPIPSYINFNDRYCSEPFQFLLAQYVADQKPIPTDVALQWITLHPEFGLRTPARRCANEFRSLFDSRYKKKFVGGLLVKPNKTPLKLEYNAASPSLRGDLKLDIPELPNPFILRGPLRKLSALVEECTVELEPYSRFLGRKGNTQNSMAALSLLPRELVREAPGAEKLRSCLAQVCVERPKLIPTELLYEAFGEKIPSKISKKNAESLALLVEGMGFGIIPDVRFYNIKPDPNDKVIIFPHGHGIDFQPSNDFRTLSAILRLGAMVSQIDQDLSPAEEATLQRLIQDNRKLTTIEKDSLMAFLYWCLRTQLSIAGLKQKLSELSIAEKTAISRILILVAHADGRIDPREVKELEKLYTTLGLNKERVTSDIHLLAAENGPITVDLRDSETTFSIPEPSTDVGSSKGFHLNEDLIRVLEEETRQVKGVLEGIFSDQDENEGESDHVLSEVAPADNPLAMLGQAHQSLFNKLIAQETWDRIALHEICKELGLMTDGAMEVLNEWAFDHVNAPLIDDGEPVYVDVNLAKEIINA